MFGRLLRSCQCCGRFRCIASSLLAGVVAFQLLAELARFRLARALRLECREQQVPAAKFANPANLHRKLNMRTSAGILLSYPRSGNHLVRVLTEFMTKRPTRGYRPTPQTDARLRAAWGIREPADENDWILMKRHSYDHETVLCEGASPRGLCSFSKPMRKRKEVRVIMESMFLIYILRHPWDGINSALRSDIPVSRVYRSLTKAHLAERDTIVENSRLFLEWPQRKIILYYEDLVADPAGVVRQLADFFGVGAAIRNETLARLPETLAGAQTTLERQPVTGADLHRFTTSFRSEAEEVPRVALPPDVWPLFARYSENICLGGPGSG